MTLDASRRWLRVIAACTLVGALLGAAILALKPAQYTSQAVTSLAADSRATDPSVLQGVTASLFMMMPVYAEQAEGAEVVRAAAGASGLTPEDVQKNLSVERSVDSSVLNWSFTARDPEAATAGLTAATREFAKSLPADGPRSSSGKPLLQVQVTQPARAGTRGRLTPAVGLLAGAALGLLTAMAALVLLRRSPTDAMADWDETEQRLGVPVAAELTNDKRTRVRQWGYVAERLHRLAPAGLIGVFGLTSQVAEEDLADLRAALARHGRQAPEIVNGGILRNAREVDAANLAGAVVLTGPDRRRPHDSVADCRALAGSIGGPVVGVVDRRAPR